MNLEDYWGNLTENKVENINEKGYKDDMNNSSIKDVFRKFVNKSAIQNWTNIYCQRNFAEAYFQK